MVATKLHASDADIFLDKDFIHLKVDPVTFGLGLDFKPLKDLLQALTKAVNMNSDAIERLKVEDLDLRESLENVEQGVVSFDGRIAECESSAREVMLQVKTAAAAEKQREQRMEEMKRAAMEAKAAANKAKDDATSSIAAAAQAKEAEVEDLEEFASAAEMRKLVKELGEMKSDTTYKTKQLEQTLEKHHADTQKSIEKIETDVKNKFEEFVADKHERLRGDVEALRQYREKDREKMAEKRDLSKLESQVEEMSKIQTQNSDRFEAAMKDVGRVSDVVQGVEGTKDQLQELWRFTRKEAKELRELCATTFEGQRREIRGKAEAADTIENHSALKRNLEDFTSRLIKLEGAQSDHGKMKAEKNELSAVNEALIKLGEEIREKEGVLFGVRRCLSCNRAFEDNNRNDNQVSLQKERQKQVLLNTIEKAVNDAGNSKVNFLSIEVGKSGMKKGVDGALYHTAEFGNDKASDPGHITRLTPLHDFALMQLDSGNDFSAMTSPSTTRSRFNETVPGLQSSRGRSHGKLPYLAPVDMARTLSHSNSSPRIGLPLNPLAPSRTPRKDRDKQSIGLAAQVQADIGITGL